MAECDVLASKEVGGTPSVLYSILKFATGKQDLNVLKSALDSQEGVARKRCLGLTIARRLVSSLLMVGLPVRLWPSCLASITLVRSCVALFPHPKAPRF